MRVQFRPLADVAHVFVGLPTTSGPATHADTAVNFLSVRSITGTGINASEMITADVRGEVGDKYRTAAGDVLIPARSTSFKSGVVSPRFAGTPINATLIGIRCSPELDPLLLSAYLRHPDGQAALAEHAQSGTMQMNITVKALSGLPVPVPPREQQAQIAAMYAAADEAYRTATAAAEQRRRLAMQIIFERMTSA
jgi:restriction endonuclease S subunit